MNPLASIPLDLVTGFLGSGKTTLINAVLRDPTFGGTMVIVNEFGEIGLDHLLVTGSQDQVVLLDSGCLCCAASGTLRDTLIDLFAGVRSARWPSFNRLIVETSGLADPTPLVAGLLGDSALNARCRLRQVVTLVDAVHGSESIARYPEARRQVAIADRILLTKLGEPGAPTLLQMQSLLSGVGAQVPIEPYAIGDDVVRYFADGPADRLGSTAPVSSVGAILMRGPFRRQYGFEGVPAADHGRDCIPIRSRAWRLTAPIDWPAYAAWTATMRTLFGKRLLRCKGLVAIGSSDRPWVIQGVQGYFAKPESLSVWPTGDREGFLVCIYESVDAGELEAAMRSLPLALH